MTDIQEKTILLIGTTGSGKSTLGNVLINQNGNFEKVFAEGEYSVSETRKIKCERVEIEGINYKLIDTPGFGDTSLEVIKIPPTLGELNEYIQLGVDYVFFVVNKKFDNKNLDIFKYLKEIFFDDDVVKYITIIFTHFPKFKVKQICEKGIEILRNESESIADIINNVNIIYINNATIIDDKDVSNKNAREDSKKIILDHLKLFRNEEKCKPRLGDLHERIKKLNEADLTQKKERLNEIGEWVRRLRIFIEWRKIMEEYIISYMSTLAFHVKTCEISAGRGRRIYLIGEGFTGAKLPLGFVIRVTGNAVDFGFTFIEIAAELIYCRKISNKIEEDKEKRLMLLREELSNKIKDYKILNRNSIEIRENLSWFHYMRAAFEKLWMLVEERRTNYDENPESNETSGINVTDQVESNEVKGFFYTTINMQKKLFRDKFQEDYKLLEIEQKELQEKYNNKKSEVKELEAKLEKENLTFFSKAQIEVSSRQDYVISVLLLNEIGPGGLSKVL
ncbi:P-loop containing nucleoside triphosphate hydrolase protein [Rhizophagus diaphanus]|nr:P-loop containing nucleoside triphosphate hydrolase protein [Rhizophagus diaphanus] [Rhizophagus sp. MUCL 43196]